MFDFEYCSECGVPLSESEYFDNIEEGLPEDEYLCDNCADNDGEYIY